MVRNNMLVKTVVTGSPQRRNAERSGERSAGGRAALETQAALAGAQAAATAFVFEGPAAGTAASRKRVRRKSCPRRLRWWRQVAVLEDRSVATRRRETRAICPARSVFSGVDAELAAVDFLTVETPDRLSRFGFTGEFNERKATRAARLTVRAEVHVLDLSSSAEGVC